MADSSDNSGLVTREFNGLRYTIGSQYADRVDAFLHDLATTGYKIKSVQGHNNRDIAGTRTPSFHAFGAAFDINPTENPVNGGTNMPENIQEIAAKYGLGWGGAWRGPKKDPMHFSFDRSEGGAFDVLHPTSNPTRQGGAEPQGTVNKVTQRMPWEEPSNSGSTSTQMPWQAVQPSVSGESGSSFLDKLQQKIQPATETSVPTITVTPASTSEATGATVPGSGAIPAPTMASRTGVADQMSQAPMEQGLPNPAADSSLPLADARAKLMGDPNYTYGTVLPLRKDNKTGKLGWAVPMMLRDPLVGGIDMANSVQTGVVTPQNTLALAGVLAGNPRAFGLRFNGAAEPPILSQEFRQNPFGATAEGSQIPASAANNATPRGPVMSNPNVTKMFDDYIDLAQKALKEGGSNALESAPAKSFTNRLIDSTVPSVAGKAAFVGASALGLPAHVADVMAQSGTRMLLEKLRTATPGSAEATEARNGLRSILSKAMNDQVKASGSAALMEGAGAGFVDAISPNQSLTPDQLKMMRTLRYRAPEA